MATASGLWLWPYGRCSSSTDRGLHRAISMSGTSYLGPRAVWRAQVLVRQLQRALLYLLALLTYTPLGPLIGIKLISVPFDLVLGYFTYRIVRLRYPHGWVPTVAAAVVLFLPTVVLNSALWGQIDATYTSLALGGLYFVLRRRPWLACIFFGLALSFKLQVVFLFPYCSFTASAVGPLARPVDGPPGVRVDGPARVGGRRFGLDPVVDLHGRDRSLPATHAQCPEHLPVPRYHRVQVLRELGIVLTVAIVLALIAVVVVRRAQLDADQDPARRHRLGDPGALPPARHARALLLPGRRPHGDLGILPTSTVVGFARPGAVRFAHVLHALPAGHHDHGRGGRRGTERRQFGRPRPRRLPGSTGGSRARAPAAAPSRTAAVRSGTGRVASEVWPVTPS